MNDSQIMVLELGSKGYSCAQILFVGALGMCGMENNLLVRAMNGLSQGGGNLGKTCGALSGGLCFLSLYAGKGNDFESALPSEELLWEELITWFNQEFCINADNSCDALLGITPSCENTIATTATVASSAEDNLCSNTNLISSSRMHINPMRCGDIVAKTWDMCREILVSHGINPFDPLEERPL